MAVPTDPNAKARLRAVLESLDELPSTIDPRTLYRQGEGDLADRYVLDPEEVDGYSVGNVNGHAKALDKERHSRRQIEAAKKKLEAEYAAAADRLKELEAQLANGLPNAKDIEASLQARLTKDFERRQAARDAELAAQMEALTKERDTYLKQTDETLLETSFSGLGAKWDYPAKLIGALLKQRTRIVADPDTGRRTRQIVDESGEPMLVNGKPATPDDLMQVLSRDAELGRYIARRDQQPPASGPNPASSNSRFVQPASGAAVRVSAEEMTDYKAWERKRKEAERTGQPIAPPPSGPQRA